MFKNLTRAKLLLYKYYSVRNIINVYRLMYFIQYFAVLRWY